MNTPTGLLAVIVLAARAVPVLRLLAVRDVLVDPVQTRANKAASAL